MFPLIHYLNYQAFFQQNLQCRSKCLLFLCSLQSFLYLCDIIFVFLHILVLRNHTKTHILIFYLFLSILCLLFTFIFNFTVLINFITYLLILKYLNRLFFDKCLRLFFSFFFFISMANTFSEKAFNV